MEEDLHAFNICGKCKRKEWIPFSKEDIEAASNSGGLFTKILDHDDHIIILKIDPNGAVRREYCVQDLTAMQDVQPIVY